MKKIFIYSAIAVVAMFAASCEPNLDFAIPGDKIGFSKTDVVNEVSAFAGTFDISIVKSGKGTSAANVTLELCSVADLKAFNDSGVDSLHTYSLVNPSAYQISETKFAFAAGETRKVATVTWDPDKFASIYSGSDAVIAVKIAECDVELDTTRSMMFIHPYISNISFSGTDIKNLYITEGETPADYMYEGSASLELNTVIPSRDVTVEVAIDESYIAAGSAARNKEYLPAPKGLFTLKSDTATIPAGELYGSFDYKIDCSVLFDANGNLLNMDVFYMIPVVIKSYTPAGLDKGQVMVAYVIVNIPDSGIVNPPIGVPTTRLHGPWEVVSGKENDMWTDPLCDGPDWYSAYCSDRLVDWNFKNTSANNSSGYWGSWWWTTPHFPLEYVFDCGEEVTYIFNKFYKVDAPSTQGQLQDFEVFVAKELAGADTDWKLAAKGNTGTKGWQAYPQGDNDTDAAIDNIIETFGYEIPFVAYTKGRYIKLVIVKTSGAYSDIKGGYLMEFFADGWEL